MNKQILFIALLIVAISGCKKKNDTPAPSLVGSWIDDNGNWEILLNADNTYSYIGSGATIEHGNYTSNETEITFSNSSSLACSSGSVGKYNYSLSATSLTFTKISDPCAYRAGVFLYSYTRQ